MTNDEILVSTMPWQEESFGLLREDPPEARIYDLEERTALFGEAIIAFCRKIDKGPHTNRLIDQITGCGTSIGANYCEADDALSKKDFIKIIGTCRKEARETKFFLRMIATACPSLAPAARQLWIEANQLHLIFSKIRRTTQSTLNQTLRS